MLKDRSAKNTKGYFKISKKDESKISQALPKRTVTHHGSGKRGK